MTRHIPNSKKLLRIVEHHAKQRDPNEPFCFSVDESLRIRQLIADSLVTFFAKLNDLPDPGPQPLPPEVVGPEPSRAVSRKKNRYK